jgi:4-amino-4-deoxy-L-arabinose transferase-like glycosyltransferase
MSKLSSTASSENDRRFVPSQVTWWMLALGALLRILFFFISANNGGDALARAAWTTAWVQHPTLKFFFGRYLPLHFWMMGGLTLLLRDPTLAGRLLSLALGIASLWLLWVLTRALYDSEAANLSLFVFSLYSLHIAYSTTSSSEAPYLCFVLAGLACFFVYRRSNSLWLLALGGIALSVAAAIRYEAWVIIFALALVLSHSVWQQLRKRDARGQLNPLILFGFTAGAWPGFWMLYVWAKMGRPFYFVNEQSASVKDQLAFAHRSALYLVTLSPGVIILTLSPVVIAGSLYALLLALREQSGREFSAVLIIFGLVQSYSIVFGSLLPLARYTLTLGTFLAMVSGYGLERMAKWFSPRAASVFRIGVVTTVVLNLGILLSVSETRNRYSDKIASISPRLRFPSYIQDVGNYLHTRLGPNDAIVFDDYNSDSNTLGAAVGLPLLPGDRAFTESSQDCSELLSYMRTKHPRYVVYTDFGTLRHCLPLPQRCPQPVIFASMEFKCVFENKIYRVYEVKYL